MDALVVIPTYNERENIQRIVPLVLSLSPRFDVLIVDDASPDGTGQAADELTQQSHGRVKVLHRAGKLGLGSAYIEGFQYALAHGYELIFEMDADFQHDPHDLPRFVEAAQTADVVIGSRYVPGGETVEWNWTRKAISQGGALYTRTLLGLPYRDVTTGYRCYRRSVLEQIQFDRLTTTGFGFQVEILYRCHQLGARITELPIVFQRRQVGQSKMSGQIFLEAMLKVWRLRQDSTYPRPTPLGAPGR